MENISKYLFSSYQRMLQQTLLVIVLSFVFAGNIFAACFGQGQRGGGTLCSAKSCAWERSDNRCNDNSECCPGKSCNSFGYCELCC